MRLSFRLDIIAPVFQECLEAVIIVSVLLSFLTQCLSQPDQDHTIYKRLVKHENPLATVSLLKLASKAITLRSVGSILPIYYTLGPR